MGKSQEDIKKLLMDESFQAWISGKASSDDMRYWDAWMKESPERRKLVEEAKIIWQSASFQPSSIPDVDREFQQFQMRLSRSISQMPEKTEKFSTPAFSRKQQHSNRIAYLVAAGFVFLLIFSGFFYFYSRYQTEQSLVRISSGYGERKTIQLPDNSIIILNANSQVSYRKNWDINKERVVYLKGEAYFKVTRLNTAQNNYFSVITTDGTIRVLGTEFSVYVRNSGTRVSLKKGKVEVLLPVSQNNAISTVNAVLKPGEMVYFQKGDQTLHPENERINLYLDWWKDSFTLHYTPLSQIVQRIEDTYGVQINVADSSLLQRTLTGTIENQNLQTILTALSKALQIPFYQEGSTIILGNRNKN